MQKLISFVHVVMVATKFPLFTFLS